MKQRITLKAVILIAMFAALLAKTGTANAEIVNVGKEKNTCKMCHGDQRKTYAVSVHNEFGILCTDCHGGDGTAIEKKDAMSAAKGFTGKFTPVQIPGMCARCHSDYSKMRSYGITSDQLELYKTSVHGKLLFEKGDASVATCVSCHGSHNILRVTDDDSPVYPTNIPATCKKCHNNKALMSRHDISAKSYDDYSKSIHFEELTKKHNTDAPSCVSCHGSHGAVPPGLGEVANICGKCHIQERRHFVRSKHYRKGINCMSCHNNHDVDIARDNFFRSSKKGACLSCHPNEKSVAGEYITKANRMLIESHMKLTAAEKDIKKAERAGMNVSAQKKIYAEAMKRVKRASALQHQTNLRLMDDILTREVDSRAEQIQTEIEVFFDARLSKILTVIIGFAIVLLIVTTLVARNRVIKGRKSSAK